MVVFKSIYPGTNYFFMWNPSSEIILSKMPKLYEPENVEAKEKIIYLHFFVGSSDWFVAEYDGEDVFFGFACLNAWKDCAEWGYMSFEKLRDLKVRHSLGGKAWYLEVEFDMWWDVRKAKDVRFISECQGW